MGEIDDLAKTADEHSQCLAIFLESVRQDLQKLEALDTGRLVPPELAWLVLRLRSATAAAAELTKAAEDLALSVKAIRVHLARGAATEGGEMESDPIPEGDRNEA